MTGTPDCGKPKPIQGTGWANRSKDCDFFKVMEAFHDNVSPAGIDKTLLKEVCDNHIVQRVYAPAVNNLSIDVRLIPWRALTLLPEGRFWVSVFESLFTVTVPERTLLWGRTMPVLLLLAAQIKKQTASAYLKTIGVEVHPDSPLSKIRKIDDTVFARVKRMTFGGEQPQLTEEVVRVLSDSMPQSEACDTVMLIDTTDKAQRSIDGVLVGSSNGRDLGVCISTKVKLSKEGGPVDATTVTNRERCSKDMAKLMKVHQQGIMEDFVQAGSAISPSLRAEPGNETTTVLSHFLLFSTGPVAKEHVNTASLTVVPEAACLRIARCFGFETSLAQVIGDK